MTPPNHPYMGSGPLAIAHRGGSKEATENTAEAFDWSRALGCRVIETDVRCTRDGVVVVYHDERLNRLSNHPGDIAELTWKQLQSVRVGQSGRVLRLEDVFERYPDIHFNIDVKTDNAVGPFCRAVRQYASPEQVTAAAFSSRRLKRIRQALGPEFLTSMGSREVAQYVAAYHAQRRTASSADNRGSRPSPAVLQVPLRWAGVPVVTPRFLEWAHARGDIVHVWTIDDPRQMETLLSAGVDGIVTDRPSLLKSVMQQCGLW